jgi:hypothetical protein
MKYKTKKDKLEEECDKLYEQIQNSDVHMVKDLKRKYQAKKMEIYVILHNQSTTHHGKEAQNFADKDRE